MFKSYPTKYVFVSVLFFLCAQLSASQTKDEKETKIRFDDFPELAQMHLSAIPKKAKRIRYYKEIDNDEESFETKFKYKKHWHSIEFDSSGGLEDIEINIKQQELKEPIKHVIDQYLSEQADKYEFIKIQEQYVFSIERSEIEFLNLIFESRAKIESSYEIIIALKLDNSWVLKEMTFNSDGQFLIARTLQQDSYEYIMY